MLQVNSIGNSKHCILFEAWQKLKTPKIKTPKNTNA